MGDTSAQEPASKGAAAAGRDHAPTKAPQGGKGSSGSAGARLKPLLQTKGYDDGAQLLDPHQKSLGPEGVLAPGRGAQGSPRGTTTTGLPSGLKAGIERISGISMDAVKVHRNSKEPAKVGALAYTRGTDIFLAPGQEAQLPHEAWHVAQQSGGRTGGAQAGGVHINDDVSLEREADRMGSAASNGHQAGTRQPTTAASPTGDVIQRRVDPGAEAGTKVRVIDSGAPGVITAPADEGYQVETSAGSHDHTYDELNPRVAGAWQNIVRTEFATLDDVDWDFTPIPNGAPYNLAGPKLIAQSPVARGDMHDIRAVLALDPQVKVLIGLTNDLVYGNDVATIVSFYQGIPNFAQRVAVVGANANEIRDRFGAQLASTSTPMLRWLRTQLIQPAQNQARNQAVAQHQLQHQGLLSPQQRQTANDAGTAVGERQFRNGLADATTGALDDDDTFDYIRELKQRGFDDNSSYVLVNSRDSGHNPGQGRPASHPELDSGARGFWDLMEAVIQAGHVPVPVGTPPAGAHWPGPSLVNYFAWPVCQANQRRNKRQAEYYLFRALMELNGNVKALAWRSGVTDAISFTGVPVIALDVAGAAGGGRAARREQMLPGHYRKVDLSNRAGNIQEGVEGWLGALSVNDCQRVRQALGNGPRHADHAALTQPTPQPPVLGDQLQVQQQQAPPNLDEVLGPFIGQLRQISQAHDTDAIAAAIGEMTAMDRAKLGKALPKAHLLALLEAVRAIRAYAARPDGQPLPQAPDPQGGMQTSVGRATGVAKVVKALGTAGPGDQPAQQPLDHAVFNDLDGIATALGDLFV